MSHIGKLHPFTGRYIEEGRGAWREDQQVELHLQQIETEEGKAAADAVRKKIADHAKREADEQKSAKMAAAAEAAHQDRIKRALALLDEKEAAEAKSKTKAEKSNGDQDGAGTVGNDAGGAESSL